VQAVRNSILGGTFDELRKKFLAPTKPLTNRHASIKREVAGSKRERLPGLAIAMGQQISQEGKNRSK